MIEQGIVSLSCLPMRARAGGRRHAEGCKYFFGGGVAVAAGMLTHVNTTSPDLLHHSPVVLTRAHLRTKILMTSTSEKLGRKLPEARLGTLVGALQQ